MFILQCKCQCAAAEPGTAEDSALRSPTNRADNGRSAAELCAPSHNACSSCNSAFTNPKRSQDVDAVWGDAGLGDLDDWSKFLEVPDLGGFLPDDAANDIFGSAGGASQPADRCSYYWAAAVYHS